MQWGYVDNGSLAYTWDAEVPIITMKGNYAAVATAVSEYGNNSDITICSKGASSFKVVLAGRSSGHSSRYFSWLVIGESA